MRTGRRSIPDNFRLALRIVAGDHSPYRFQTTLCHRFLPRASPTLLRSQCACALAESRFQNQLLHAPVCSLCNINFVFGRAGELMTARELLELPSGAPDNAEHFAVQCHLEDASGKRKLTDEHNLIRARCNA